MSVLPKTNFISEEEYWAIDAAAELRHEYFDGEIFVMSGGTPSHAIMIASAIGTVSAHLRGKNCYPTSSDQRVKVQATGLQTYPDLAIVCPPPRYDPRNANTLLNPRVLFEVLSPSTERYDPRNANTLLNPRVLFEVLSPSTERYDRTTKLAHYQQIPETRDIVLIDPNRVRVEHFHRQSDGWLFRSYVRRADTLLLELPDMQLALTLSELYERLDVSEGLEMLPAELDAQSAD